ncbi:MAG: Smr/MutS family protein [Deltaproteobacteria bacterium]|nr:Smr/MutS family protein [Deltaproteobacteria bacterium]
MNDDRRDHADADDETADDAPLPDDAVALPIDGVLDLHTFHPREVAALVAEYLDECRRAGISEVRIVHGKGTGQLRRTVHAALQRHPAVASFRPAGTGEGSWGATMVTLRPATGSDEG